MFGGFQSNAFQSNAFQIIPDGKNTPENSGGTPYTYIPADQQREIERRKLIATKKTELQKVVSVIGEYERQRELAEESLKIASEKSQARLLKAQNELIAEINRLLIVKAELVARIRREEEQLILMAAMRRRRFRIYNLT
jgi:hypothetical protein